MMNNMFILPARKEPDPIMNSRTSAAPEPKNSQSEKMNEEKPKSLSFRDLLEKTDSPKEQKGEKLSGSEGSGKNVKNETKQVHANRSSAKEIKNADALAPDKTAEGKGLKEKLIKDIFSFLEKNKESVKSLHGNPKIFDRAELEKQSPKDLKDLLDRLKTDVSMLFQAKMVIGQMHDAKPKDSATKKDDSKKVETLAEKDQAFKVDNSGEKPKYFVNRDKVEVIDRRTAKDSLEQSAKIQNDTLKGGSVKADDLQKKDGASLTRNDQTSFKDLLAKREIGPMDSKGPIHDVRETNKVFNDIVQHSKLMLQNKKQTMEIDLKPDHLGKITLKIEMVDNKLVAQIIAQNETTGDMLKQNMGNMSQSFKDAGLNLQSLNVDVGSGNKNFNQMMGDDVSGIEKMLSLNPEVSDDEREGLYQATGYNWNVGRQSVDYIV